MSGGQLITVGQGTLSPGTHGQQINVLQGILTASGNSNTVNITGSEITSQQGFVSAGATLLSGLAITTAAGTIGIDRTKAITGLSSTIGQGTLSAVQEADDTYIQSGIGSSAANFNIAISGIESTMGQGTIVYSQGLLVGSAATFEQQSFPALQITKAITGLGITSGIGMITQVGGVTPPPVISSGGGVRKRDAKYTDFYLPPGQRKKNEPLAHAIASVAQKDPDELVKNLKAALAKLGIEWEDDYGDIAKNLSEMEGDIDYELLAHAMLFMLE